MAAATETRKPPATPVRIAIDAIIIGRGRRKATNENVSSLMTSITAIGLRTPISVLSRDADGYHPLVAGRHRLEACRALGHTEIEAWVISDNRSREMGDRGKSAPRRTDGVAAQHQRRPLDQVDSEADRAGSER